MSEQIDHRVYSSEFEYGILYNRSFEVPQEFWQNLPAALGQSAGISMRANGSRIYPDCGHVEYAAPESSSLDDFVHAELAGEQIVIDTLKNLAEASRDDNFRVHKRGIDSAGNNYGSHVSYNVSNVVRFDRIKDEDKARNVRALASLYSARMALVGGGYYNTELDEWHVSQRINCFDKMTSMSCHSKGSRPLVDIRNEAFADERFRRLHDSSSDPNVSVWALRTKVGFTSAYLRLLESGVDLERFFVANPLYAAHTIAADTELKQVIELEGGKRVTALNQLEGMAGAIIQFHEDGGYIPNDELRVAQEVHDLAIAAKGDRDVLLYKSDWVTRMLGAERMAEKKARNHKEYLALLAAGDQHYDMLACKPSGAEEPVFGPGRKLREQMKLGQYSPEAVEELKANPPQSSRAWLRGKLIQASFTDEVADRYGPVTRCSWDFVRFGNLDKSFLLSDPKKWHPNRVMRRIFKAAELEWEPTVQPLT